LIPFLCVAQKKKKEKQDTLKVTDFVPTGLRIGTDVIALIKTSTDDTYSGWEVNADLDLYRYFLTVDVGSWSRNFQSTDGQYYSNYSNDGNYFRVGADFNFLPKDPNGNALIFGARYARSVFSEDYVVHSNDTVWGPIDETYINANVPARWFELTGGLRVKIWKILWLGYTARYKFSLKTGDTPTMLPHDIPGYGRTDKKSAWGFNYQVFIRFPLRK
ncbi:MAG TPA: DUF6048 family protein, partial [Cyclobacteriaceae bacterium]|nr:DUF6048 family protein [Cyclobacteriaceae bacterium]